MIKPPTRRSFILMTVAALCASPVMAVSIADQIVSQLTEQGFADITVGRTLLGRVRIVALNEQYRREIIIDPRTGEILRDLTTTLNGKAVAAQISGSGQSSNTGSGGNSGSGNSGGDDHEDDDDHDDDHEDDDEHDDNSGHGSGNSGSGNSGSGNSGGGDSGGGDDGHDDD